MITVGLLEDNKLMARHLGTILENWDFVSEVFYFETNEEFQVASQKTPLNVLLVDLDLNGESGIKSLIVNSTLPEPAIAIVVSSSLDAKLVILALSNGAIGYLYKNDPEMKVIEGIKSSLRGESPISMQIASILVKKLNNPGNNQLSDDVNTLNLKKTLTNRETQILEILAKGLSNKEIANIFDLSVHTINVHVRNIYRKLQAANRTEAVFEAKAQGLL
ncbi:MAG: response regulator transcription factor [Ascidiaceihabitans sp.]|nr:response regulator transcription factor [Ascidiaceihabitans sp.]